MKDRTKLSERQRNILRFIENHLENHGFPPTIRQIGKATGIESTSVVNYNLNKLVSAGYLSREARASRGLRLVKANGGKRGVSANAQTMIVPMYGQIVAGQPVPIPEDLGHTPLDNLDVLPSMLGNANPSDVYALRVKGDSMIDAMINDGDIVVLRRQDDARNGEMVAVWLDDRNEVTLKYFYNEGNRVRLQPAHPSMDPIYVDSEHVHIQGRVLSVLRLSV
jgi:repressor LexA